MQGSFDFLPAFPRLGTAAAGNPVEGDGVIAAIHIENIAGFGGSGGAIAGGAAGGNNKTERQVGFGAGRWPRRIGERASRFAARRDGGGPFSRRHDHVRSQRAAYGDRCVERMVFVEDVDVTVTG